MAAQGRNQPSISIIYHKFTEGLPRAISSKMHVSYWGIPKNHVARAPAPLWACDYKKGTAAVVALRPSHFHGHTTLAISHSRPTIRGQDDFGEPRLTILRRWKNEAVTSSYEGRASLSPRGYSHSIAFACAKFDWNQNQWCAIRQWIRV